MLAHLRRLGPITSAELRKNAPRFFLTPDTLRAANPYPYLKPRQNLVAEHVQGAHRVLVARLTRLHH